MTAERHLPNVNMTGPPHEVRHDGQSLVAQTYRKVQKIAKSGNEGHWLARRRRRKCSLLFGGAKYRRWPLATDRIFMADGRFGAKRTLSRIYERGELHLLTSASPMALSSCRSFLHYSRRGVDGVLEVQCAVAEAHMQSPKN